MWEANEKHRSVHQQECLIKYTLTTAGSDLFTTKRVRT